MTELEKLAQWSALADAATPGPWETGEEDGMIYVADDSSADSVAYCGCSLRDAAFIAAARAAVPALLAEVERLRDELAEAERLRDAYKVELGGMCKAMADSSLLPTGFIAAELRKERIEALYGAFGADETKWPDSAKARLAGLQEDQARYEARYT